MNRKTGEAIKTTILNLVNSSGERGMTASILSMRIGKHPSTVRSYLCQLKKEGLITFIKPHYYGLNHAPNTTKPKEINPNSQIVLFPVDTTPKRKPSREYTVQSPIGKLAPIPLVNGKPDLDKFKIPKYKK